MSKWQPHLPFSEAYINVLACAELARAGHKRLVFDMLDGNWWAVLSAKLDGGISRDEHRDLMSIMLAPWWRRMWWAR